MITESKDYLKYIPLITAFFIFSGIIHAMVYYGYFHFNILPMLEIGEILILFLNKMLLVGIGLLFAVLVLFKMIKDLNYKGRLILFAVLMVLNTIGIIITVKLFSIPFDTLNVIMAFLMILILLVTPFLMFYILKRKFIFNINANLLIANLLAFSFLIIISLSGIISATAVETNPSTRTKCIITFEENRKLETNDSLIYLGRTKNYLIIHNLNSRMNSVIKSEDVKELKIKNYSIW